MAVGPGLRAACACGKVVLQMRGAPIAAAVCYCDDCQAAGRLIEALPDAQSVLDPDAGSSLVMYRRDRLSVAEGAELLRPIKLKPETATVRFVAGCCNSAMYLGFEDSKHWVDVFRSRIIGEAPPITARMCTRYLPVGTKVPDDAPSTPGFYFPLVAKVLAARIAMLFGP
jgi:hypothetical protein